MGARVRLAGLLVVVVFVVALPPGVGAWSLSGPEITGFSPAAGVVGTAVAVTGSGFTGATGVTFNGVAATFTVGDDADIQTSVPFGATTGKIAVTTPAGSETSAASFRVQPLVSGFSPGWGWPATATHAGTVVTITGSAFTGATAVSFHGVEASFTVESYSEISATVPPGATTGKVRVTTKVGTASSGSVFDVLVAGPGWSQFGFDNANSGFNPNETILSPGNVSTLQIDWHDKTGKTDGAVSSSPAVVDGVAYAGTTHGKLYAFDAASGAVLWTASTGDAIYSSPAVTDGVAYVGSQDFKLYAFDAVTGVLLWSTATGWYVFDAPAVANGIVYVNVGFNLEALDSTSGALLWSAPTGNYILGSPAVANGLVYVGSQDFKVYAFDAATGAQRWNATTGAAIYTSAAVADGVVYVSAHDGNLHAFDAATGALLWSAPTGSAYPQSPAVASTTVYVGSGGNLEAFDARTGRLRWQASTGGDTSPPALANGVVYVGSGDSGNGSVYTFDASTGVLLGNVPIVGYIGESPAVTNGRVYLGTAWKLNALHLPST